MWLAKKQLAATVGQGIEGPHIGPDEKRNASIKTNLGRFDSLVASYYPAVYNFASRLTDDPREAVLLTYRAFNSIRNPTVALS